MKGNMYYHPGNQLRVIKGTIQTPSGATPTIRVLHYDAGLGHCRVFIVGSEGESWEENWSLTQRHSPQSATFWRQDVDGDSIVEVTLKSA